MSIGALLSFIAGILGPAAMGAACVFELLSRRLSRDPRSDKDRIEKLKQVSDVGLVAAWLLLAAAYLLFQYAAPDAAAVEPAFQRWMTWMLCALLVLDIVYLYLRRARPRKPGSKKKFWEI